MKLPLPFKKINVIKFHCCEIPLLWKDGILSPHYSENKKASCRNSSLKKSIKHPQNWLTQQKALWLCIRQQQQFIKLISVLLLLILPTVLSQKILHQTELFAMLSAFFLSVKHFIAFYWGFELEEKREYFFVRASHAPFSFILLSPRTKARSSSLFCPFPTIRP